MHLELLFFTLHDFKIFYQRTNNTNTHNNVIGGISTFQKGLNYLFTSAGFYFKSKAIEDSHKGQSNMASNFWPLFFIMYISEVLTFFWSIGYPAKSVFSVAVCIYQIHVFDRAFFLLTISMAMAIKRSGWWHVVRDSHP